MRTTDPGAHTMPPLLLLLPLLPERCLQLARHSTSKRGCVTFTAPSGHALRQASPMYTRCP